MQSKREMFFKGGEAQSPSGPPPQPPSLINNLQVNFCRFNTHIVMTLMNIINEPVISEQHQRKTTHNNKRNAQ